MLTGVWEHDRKVEEAAVTETERESERERERETEWVGAPASALLSKRAKHSR
jgi:hypothetical protein